VLLLAAGCWPLAAARSLELKDGRWVLESQIVWVDGRTAA